MGRRVVYAASADLASTAAHNVHILRMCEALSALGDRVTLVVKNSPPWDIVAASFGLSGRFDIITSASWAGRLKSAQFALAVLRASGRADLVLTRDLPAALVAAAAGRPTIFETHAPFNAARSRFMFRLLLRMKRFIGLAIITRALETHFIDEFGERLKGRTIVLPDGANPGPKVGGGGRKLLSPSIGYVGTFLPGKGAGLVLRIAEAMPEAHFYLVGGDAADAGVMDGDIPDNVHFVGRVPHSETTSWIESFDVALLPNSDSVFGADRTVDIGRWTSPLKLFEYMAAARPIVASRLPVLQEVLVDGRNCLLADAADVAEWVARIRALVSDPRRAARLGKQAREDLESRYTWRGRAERIVAFAAGSGPKEGNGASARGCTT